MNVMKDLLETPVRRGGKVAAVLFVAVMAALTLYAAIDYRFPLVNGDEHGHVSYVAHLVKTGVWWPDLATMPIYDRSGAATAIPNFINHPPLFYWLAEPAYRGVQALGLDPSFIRAFSFVFAIAAYVAIAAFGLRAGFGPAHFMGLLTAMAFLLTPNFAAPFNNDQMALLGGALACLGAWRRLDTPADSRGLAILLLGVALCSVKLTALLLVGGFACFALVIAPRPKLDLRGVACLAATLAVVSLPYLVLWRDAGGIAPSTPGHDLVLRSYAAAYGWDAAPRLGFIEYLAEAPFLFALEVGPGLLPVGVLAAMFAALACSILRPVRAEDAAAHALARAALAATIAMLAVHLAFSYRRHLDYGWLGDFHPRYYFPLIAAYGLGWSLCARRLRDWASVLWTRALSVIRPQFSEKPVG